MKNYFLLILFLFILACSSEKKETKKSSFEKRSGELSVNNEETKNKVNNKVNLNTADKNLLFQKFLLKFKRIDFPFTYRFITHQNIDQTIIDISKMPKVNMKSSDSLFMSSKDFPNVYCYGLLKDTTNFYSLIYFFDWDVAFPVLATYSKFGELINYEHFIVYGCGPGCGQRYCSQSVELRKDFSIKMVDSLKWDFDCDDEGNPIPNSSNLNINIKNGSVNKEGKIVFDKIIRKRIKLASPMLKNN